MAPQGAKGTRAGRGWGSCVPAGDKGGAGEKDGTRRGNPFLGLFVIMLTLALTGLSYSSWSKGAARGSSAALEKAAAQAYRMAGLKKPRRDIDVVEVGDEFSYQELLWLEGLGLCDRGEAGRMIDSGVTALKGKMPVNPSGGLLGGVPANVAGLNRVAEAVLQLRGEAGDYQVKNPNIALAQGHSGFCGQHQCVIVLGN